MNTAIAQHLNVTESAIIRVEEWANVIFAVVRGLGARFVSKKVVKMEKQNWIKTTKSLPVLSGSEKQVKWADAIRLETLYVIQNQFKNKLVDFYGISEDIASAITEEIASFTKTVNDSKFFINNRTHILSWSSENIVDPIWILAQLFEMVEGKAYLNPEVRNDLIALGKSQMTVTEVKKYFAPIHA